MTKTLRIAGLSMLAIAALAAAGTAAVTIKRTPKEGQVTKYRMKADLEYMGLQVNFNGLTQEKITKVDSDGTYTIEQSPLETKITVGGAEQPGPAVMGSTTILYGGDGGTKEIKGEGVSGYAYRMATLTSFIVPTKELNVDDAWSHEFKADAKTGAVAAKADFKYLGEEKVGAADTYKVKAVINETEGTTPASSDTTIWVDKVDGQLVKMEGKWVKAPIPGINQQIDANVSIVREP